MVFFKKFLKNLNFWKETKELGLPVWESPSVLFFAMGVFTIIIMVATYFVSNVYDDPALVIAAVSLVTVIILAFGSIIIKSVEKLVQANQMKSEFISIASHELKTPLSAIKWALDLLLNHKDEKFSQEQMEYLVAIKENNEYLIRLASILLDVSKIESKTFTLNPAKESIVSIIEGLMTDFQSLAQKANVRLTFTPPQNPISVFYFDPERIKIVLYNLVNNAIKYIKENGTVNLSVLEHGDKKVIVRVKDTGVGIPKHDQPFIFSKFYRSGNEMQYQTHGAGLGLFIAKAFVEASGGKIGFESSEGSGSTFWFSLPIK